MRVLICLLSLYVISSHSIHKLSMFTYVRYPTLYKIPSTLIPGCGEPFLLRPHLGNYKYTCLLKRHANARNNVLQRYLRLSKVTRTVCLSLHTNNSCPNWARLERQHRCHVQVGNPLYAHGHHLDLTHEWRQYESRQELAHSRYLCFCRPSRSGVRHNLLPRAGRSLQQVCREGCILPRRVQ
jgi:hypothetical protein